MGRKFSEEDKKVLVELVKEEIEAHRQGRIKKLTSGIELAKLTPLNRAYFSTILNEILPKEYVDYRNFHIKRNYNDEQINSVCQDYVYFNDSIEDISKNYSIKNPGQIKRLLSKGIKKFFITEDQRNEARKRYSIKMVQRKIIGKIQITIGAVVLLASVIGFFIVNNWHSNAEEQITKNFLQNLDDIKNTEEGSNDTLAIFAQNLGIYFENQGTQINTWQYALWLFFSLFIVISVFYITQGLVNLADL